MKGVLLVVKEYRLLLDRVTRRRGESTGVSLGILIFLLIIMYYYL